MGHSLSLAAFLLLTAQIQEPRLMPVPSEPGSVPRVISSPAAAPKQTYSWADTHRSPAPVVAEEPSSGQFRLFPRLRERISSLFGGSSSAAPAYQPRNHLIGQPNVASKNPPVIDKEPPVLNQKPQPALPHQAFRKPPVVEKEPATIHNAIPKQNDIAAPANANIGVQTKYNLKLNPRFETKVGHDENYQWITGQLFHLTGRSNTWVVRYAVDGEIDRLGGYVVLGGNVDMKQFRSGDLVSVTGTVANASGLLRSSNMPVYQATNIHLIERP